MKIKLTEASVQKVIDAGANHWVKGDFDRYYIDVKDLVDYDFYKSGNVSYASIDGEKISNTKGTQLLCTKIFVENDELVSDSEELVELAMNHYGLEEFSEVADTEDSTADKATDEVVEDESADSADTVKTLDSYLNKFELTRYRLAKLAHLDQKTLQRASEQEATRMNSNVVLAIAETLHKMPGQVLDELIEMEMENDMTDEETKLLLINVLDEADATALVTIEDMGDDVQAIVAEIDLPSGDTVRFAVNKAAEPITKFDVLTELSYAMDDYDHEDDGEFFPSQPVEGADRPLIDAEFMGVSKEDSKYLSDLSNNIFKTRK